VARLLTRDGELISRLETIDVVGSVFEAGVPFYAVVPDEPGVVIRKGAVLIETDDGVRHAAEVDQAEVITDPLGPVIRVTGVLGDIEPES
jgi:hypothetical protein